MSSADAIDLRRIASWLSRQGIEVSELQPLPGDVSPRRYVRAIADGGDTSVIAVYPPDDLEAGERFIRTTAVLQTANVRVPEIRAWSADTGLMLLEDAGRETAFEWVRRGGSAMSFWQQAIEVARRVAQLPPADVGVLNGALEGATLRRELQQSWDLVLEPWRLIGDQELAGELHLALLSLCDALHEGPRSPCHRDLMARNFLRDAEGEWVVIDHQDLRLGPAGYDLASLLNDTLYASPEEEARALRYARLERVDLLRYHRAAAQRALKIVGTFAAFARRGSERYLELIPPSLAAAARHLRRVPETAPILEVLASRWEAATTPG